MGQPAREEDDDVSIRIPTAPDPEAALQAVRDKAPPPVKPTPVADPRAQEVYTFHVDFTAADGSHYEGSFTNQVLTPQLMLDRGLLMTVLANGVPFSLMDEDSESHFRANAHMQVSLKKTPGWWKLAREGVNNMSLFQAVYQEVVAHEVTFLGPAPSESESES